MITPYKFLNIRNKLSDRSAYFVVLARTEDDVVKAVLFAKKYSLPISVFSTGHEFNDRNSGQGNNSLLVRTLCLRTSEIDLEETNAYGHADGIIRLGAGMTWSTSKLGDIGVHQIAAEVERVVVSGHAGNVGIVGWSLGGGHGQLVGTYGMGVDQVLEVEMVTADGSKVIANELGTTQIYTDGTKAFFDDSELFWALRGGGAGTWGIITAMTIKLHSNRNSCVEDCFTQWTANWIGSYAEDGPELLEELIHSYLSWTGKASKYWSSYALPYFVDDYHFGFIISEALYVGTEKDDGDFNSFYETFSVVRSDKQDTLISKTYNRFIDKMKDQTPESVDPKRKIEPMVSVLMNKTSVESPEAAKMLVNNWIPRCFLTGSPCVATFLFMHTVSTGDEDDLYAGTAVSPAFRQAKMHVSALGYISLTHEMSLEEKIEFAHNEIGPDFYRYTKLRMHPPLNPDPYDLVLF